ncbi:alpha,alpha-trehalose-phosphate synthase [Dorcoceras hygrometricum]|uniref:Alpha,alpha-trehalose-phosphate synthase n=1 Tax=Dorcoceras hygrometricum TaxID=472368 RepID=A0A2Z6ZUM9_9LAMI|nr:alpha,alpha-trehalose-phosphate synthase [Dorcoceras hygrometricum]
MLVARCASTRDVSSARKLLRTSPDDVAPLAGSVARPGRPLPMLLRHDAARWAMLAGRCRPLRRAASRDGARTAAASFSWWRRRRRRPPLRCRSGDVVTAGLILSRVWFGQVPGSP